MRSCLTFNASMSLSFKPHRNSLQLAPCSKRGSAQIPSHFHNSLIVKLEEQTCIITIGNGLQDSVLRGPLVSRGKYDKVREAVASGKKPE